MTRDPERLLNATTADDSLEREVLTTLRDAKAPTQARAAAWEGVAAGIAAASLPAVGAAASVAPPSTAGAKLAIGWGTKAFLGTVAKVTAFAVLSGAALGATAFWANRQGTWQPAPRAATTPHMRVRQPTAAHVVAPQRVASSEAPAASPAPSSASVVTSDAPSPRAAMPAQTSKAAAPVRLADKRVPNARLAEESALLATARAQLKQSDVAAADASLRRLRSRFPRGALVQEREVLEIAVLTARGETEAARHAARTFVAHHPNSPHSTGLRSWLVEP